MRGLERQLAKICRRVVKAHLLGEAATAAVDSAALEHYLGVP